MKSVFLQHVRIEPNLRRSLSAGIAVVLLGMIVGAPVSMLEGCNQRRDEIEALRADVWRLTDRVVAPGARQVFGSSPSGDIAELLAPSAEAAGAHMQATMLGLASILETTEVRLDSVRTLPALPEGTATAIRASVSLAVPGSRVFDVVNALEASTPPIVIDSLRVISRVDANVARSKGLPGAERARGELTLVLRVYARSGSGIEGPLRSGGRGTSRAEVAP